MVFPFPGNLIENFFYPPFLPSGDAWRLHLQGIGFFMLRRGVRDLSSFPESGSSGEMRTWLFPSRDRAEFP